MQANREVTCNQNIGKNVFFITFTFYFYTSGKSCKDRNFEDNYKTSNKIRASQSGWHVTRTPVRMFQLSSVLIFVPQENVARMWRLTTITKHLTRFVQVNHEVTGNQNIGKNVFLYLHFLFLYLRRMLQGWELWRQLQNIQQDRWKSIMRR